MTSVLSTLFDHTHHSSQSLIFKGEHCFQRDLVFSRVKQTTVRAKENRRRGSKAKCRSFTLINTPIETTDKDLDPALGSEAPSMLEATLLCQLTIGGCASEKCVWNVVL